MLRHPGVPHLLFALAVLGAVVVGAASMVASADHVVLTNGRILKGEITEADDDVVRVKVSGGTVTLPRSRVASIHRGADGPAESVRRGDERDEVAHAGGGGEKRGDFRYLDGTDPETREIAQTRFTVFEPVGELAHGTLIEVLEIRDVNGVEMARIKAGELSGWISARWLKAPAAPEPILGR